MEMNKYQEGALKTFIKSDNELTNTMRMVLGLCGETGEIAEKYKKALRDNTDTTSEEFKNEVAKELGDVMWYLALLSHLNGFDMETVAMMNYDKLMSRYQRDAIKGSGDNR